MIKSVAIRLEELGFDSAWLFDHFYPFPWDVTDLRNQPSYECWTLLPALAAVTRRIRLGTLVSCVGYRNPALLAKMASIVDVISNGRLELGLGAGWYEQEFKAYGYGFPKPADRISALADAVAIIKAMWTSEEATYKGKIYSVERALNSPKPVQKPHPPIMIGGQGEKLTLKVAAQHADIWNASNLSLKDYSRKIEVLRKHCSSVGRDFKRIRLSWKGWSGPFAEDMDEARIIAEKTKPPNTSVEDEIRKVEEKGLPPTPDGAIERIEELVKLGVDHVIIYPHMIVDGKFDSKPLELFSRKVIPRFK